MEYIGINTITVSLAFIVMIILALLKNMDTKNAKKYQEGIMFTFAFGAFILLVVGCRYISNSEQWTSIWPMFITSLLGSGLIIFMTFLIDNPELYEKKRG